MNINKNKKIIIAISSILIIFLGAIGAYTLAENRNNDDNNTSTVTMDENIVREEDIDPTADTPSETDTKQDTDLTDEKVITPAPTASDGESPEKPQITRAEQSGDNVRVSAIFAESSNGTCKLTLKNGSMTVEKTAAIIVGPSYYTCNGFRVPTNELAAGSWSVSVTHTHNEKSTISDTKTININ